MASKLMIAGIVVLILGGFLFVLFSLLFPIIGTGLYPFYVTTGSVSVNESFPQNTEDQFELVRGIPRTPLPIMGVQLKVSFYLQGQDAWDCDVWLIYRSADETIGMEQQTKKTLDGDAGGEEGRMLATIYTSISGPYASKTFDMFLYVDNTGISQIRLLTYRVDVSYSLFAQVLPLIIAVVGVALTVVSIVMGRKPSAPKVRGAPGGWEPTLQWGSGSATPKKQPKMAIKSTKAPKTVKKVVKTTAPEGGAQASCKFCGKPVPASAYFCPHCYGKLR
ncbi:MAG: hypothetical protein ACFFB2_18555 [Promethearchaeota archaeon]